MTTLVVGANGATGGRLVRQLLARDEPVRALVRSVQTFTLRDEKLEVVEASVSDLDESQMDGLVAGCRAVASCLGHNLSLRGMYGHPRRLVTDAARRLCEAIVRRQPEQPVKFVLMSSSGVRNHDLHESVSFAQRVILALLRTLVPPHLDNEQAAEFLRVRMGQDHPSVEWVAVRPDGLTDEDEVSEYEVHPSPTLSAIFDAGKTSRINVAHFMAELITDDEAWSRWKGRMPVIYGARE